MKTLLRSILLVLALVVGAALTASAGPTVDITVKQKGGGKTVQKTQTDANGKFSVGNLSAGSYTLEFRSAKASAGKQDYAIAIQGTKKTIQQVVFPAAKLAGGVALNVEVGAAAKVSGSVTTEAAAQTAVKDLGPNRKIVDGVEYVFVMPEVGSHMPGRWVRAGTQGSMSNIRKGDRNTLRDMQDRTSGAAAGN